MTDTVVDDELLYRCVFFGRNCYQIDGKTVHISSQAFADTNQAPSVDRAKLCAFEPIRTQKDVKDGVISLVTIEVRMIDTVVTRNDKGKIICTYKIDVYPAPIVDEPNLQDNPAHAEIRPTPEYQSKSVFRKLLERLAFLANQREWEILPYELRTEENS